jgi:copper(I)-binding protein
VTEEDQEFIVETLVRADRANVGWTSKETANNLVHLTEATDRPLSEQQAENYIYHTLRNDKRVKNKLVTAQKTTSKCSMTSVAHQWRWMLNIKEALDFLR